MCNCFAGCRRLLSACTASWRGLCLCLLLCQRLVASMEFSSLQHGSHLFANNNQIYIAPYGRNFRGAGRSQINEDTVEPSLTAQDVNL